MRILGLSYDKCHPVHKVWFEEVGDVKELKIENDPSITNIIRYAIKSREIDDKYNVILCEGKVPLRTAVVKKIFNPKLKIITLVADQELFDCVEKGENDLEERILYKFVDGAIVNSEFIKQYAEKYIDAPIETVTPFVSNIEKYLEIEKDSYNNRKILFVGYNYPNKNIENLVEAVKRIENLSLDIVGKGHKEYQNDDITVHGYQEDLTQFLKNADLYVQPSHGDAFGVAPAEAMAAGIPVIVTQTTGIKDIVSEVDTNLVRRHNIKGLEEGIRYYYSLNQDDRKKIGEELRSRAETLTEKGSKADFKNKVNKLLSVH